MRDPIHTVSASSVSPSPYPVSTRKYKKKDYDYLSNFSKMPHSALGVTGSDAARLQERSDCESDLFMTSSTVGYAPSVTSSSSASSTQSYAQNLIAEMEAEGKSQHHHHRHQQQQQHQHDVLITEKCARSPHISEECTESGVEMKDDKVDESLSADAKDDKSNITGDAPSPIEKASGAQVKVTGRSQSKPKPRPDSTPAVLPKFGSWDTRNPSSGDAYTLIFRRLRDEKQSGGLPVCTSPTHANEEGPEESLSQESKPKEPLHPKPAVQKDSTRQKAKGKSHQEARKNATRWNLCCNASVLDD